MKTAHFIILSTTLLFAFMGIGHYFSPKIVAIQCADLSTKRVMYEGKVYFVEVKDGNAQLTTANGTAISLSNVNCKEL